MGDDFLEMGMRVGDDEEEEDSMDYRGANGGVKMNPDSELMEDQPHKANTVKILGAVAEDADEELANSDGFGSSKALGGGGSGSNSNSKQNSKDSSE